MDGSNEKKKKRGGGVGGVVLTWHERKLGVGWLVG